MNDFKEAYTDLWGDKEPPGMYTGLMTLPYFLVKEIFDLDTSPSATLQRNPYEVDRSPQQILNVSDNKPVNNDWLPKLDWN